MMDQIGMRHPELGADRLERDGARSALDQQPTGNLQRVLAHGFRLATPLGGAGGTS